MNIIIVMRGPIMDPRVYLYSTIVVAIRRLQTLDFAALPTTALNTAAVASFTVVKAAIVSSSVLVANRTATL